jgi:hypothetical protein
MLYISMKTPLKWYEHMVQSKRNITPKVITARSRIVNDIDYNIRYKNNKYDK